MAYRLDDFSAVPSRTSVDFFSPDQTNSRAVSAAMRALQERIRSLETENEHLTRSLRLSEDRLPQESALWKTRYDDQMRTEQLLRSRIRELEDEISSIKGTLQGAIEQVRILENQMRVNQTETHRNVEKCKLDRESWLFDKENLEKIVEDKVVVERQLQAKISMLQIREKTLLEELRKIQENNREMKEEMNYFRANHTVKST